MYDAFHSSSIFAPDALPQRFTPGAVRLCRRPARGRVRRARSTVQGKTVAQRQHGPHIGARTIPFSVLPCLSVYSILHALFDRRDCARTRAAQRGRPSPQQTEGTRQARNAYFSADEQTVASGALDIDRQAGRASVCRTGSRSAARRMVALRMSPSATRTLHRRREKPRWLALASHIRAAQTLIPGMDRRTTSCCAVPRVDRYGLKTSYRNISAA
ncbi:hypothetical protein FA95DRAFT_865134 [Auriscalpium vulgare]|uniref:Uncharacterized protein n=1 Tax=Auriscalpium vulgare TaxID=40419 RepID=A0ACB8R9D1_9AGAM|nr:hypothetical protein FA95DRAFT_865134 [Auriscalpium vulgare]